MKPLNKTLDEMQEKGVIELVEHSTDWVNSMVCTEKKNGKLQPCLDPREQIHYERKLHDTYIPAGNRQTRKTKVLHNYQLIMGFLASGT